MKRTKQVSKLGLISLLLLSIGIASPSESDNKNDWPKWRGANQDGKATQTGVFKFDEGYGIQIAWKKPLGSGYSSVSVAAGRTVTMFSDSTFDYIIAFDAMNGKELWHYQIDSTYVGHDGSHDGPISTPLIAGDKVYGLAPRGQLFAIDVGTGQKIWEKHLVEDHYGKKPWYGFSTSPILAGDVLILETGGDNQTISGFDTHTGKLLWSTGTDTVSYQSPITMNIQGQDQLLCIGDKYLYGLEPESGNLLWEYRHGGGWMSNNPVTVGDDRLFLHYKRNESVLLELKNESGEYAIEEVWKSRNLKATYSTPVYYQGYLYGYNSRFLGCVDAVSGKKVWKSRQPGDGFLILVDGHLVVLTKKGTLHIAEASPEGYREKASLELFEHVLWTPASFANGSIYARSLGEIARIDIVKVDQVVKAEEAVIAPNSKFGQFIKKVEASLDKKAQIDQFMNAQQRFPVIEGDNLVHFIFRGAANDMGIIGDMIGDRREETMRRIEGTDFFYYSTYLEPNAKVSYRFIKDLEETIVDSLNSERAPSIFGERSLVAMPKWIAPKHLEAPSGIAQGRVDSVQFESKVMATSRMLDVYLPVGYDESDQSYSVAYVHWGTLAQNWGKMTNTLDNLIDSQHIFPVIAVFVRPLPRDRGDEFTGNLKDKYAQMVAEELVPFIDEHYRTISAPEARANIGEGFAGFMAFYSTLKYPGIFGKVASQSIFMLTYSQNELKALISSPEEQPLHIYLDWAKYDYRSTFEGWDMGKSNREFAAYLKERGYALAGGEAIEGFGWAFWRHRTDKILETFFAAKKGSKTSYY